MRDIKFRAYDRRTKVMFPVHALGFGKISNELERLYGVDIRDKDSDSSGDVSYGGHMSKKTGNPLLPQFEIMQYTGLKDKNGKEIYDNDIFKAPHDFGPGGFDIRQAVVRWHEVKGYQWEYWLLDQLEVIGNIYENPELLK